jgi:polyisoprenoid-binding protein YceI
MKKLFLGLLLSLPLLAGSLQLQDGSIEAHTEMMMDSEINPLNKSLQADVSIEGVNINTLAGKFWVDLNLFASDKKDRDEHMYKSLESTKFTSATFSILNVQATAEKDIYSINGKLNFHGVEKALEAKAKIYFENNTLHFEATSMINMPDYGIEMPCMVFMCVRDQVDLVVKATFTK